MAGNRLAVASQHALSTSLTPQFLREVQDQAGEVHFRLTSANLDECIALLLSRRVDLAITYQVKHEASPVRVEFIETLVVGTDRLVPVVGRESLSCVEKGFLAGEVPAVTYPVDVFFGEVMNRHVLPLTNERIRLQSRAESALTLAVLELSVAGFGVAWVPLSVVRSQLQSGEVTTLEGRLPSVELQVLASRLTGPRSPIEIAAWDIARVRSCAAEGRQSSPHSFL